MKYPEKVSIKCADRGSYLEIKGHQIRTLQTESNLVNSQEVF